MDCLPQVAQLLGLGLMFYLLLWLRIRTLTQKAIPDHCAQS